MIRITYSDDVENYYADTSIARFWIINRLFETKGEVMPVEAVEVFGVTTGGVIVERELQVRLGLVEFEEVGRGHR